MNTFLSKISQLDSIYEVILLSLQGGVLFRRQAGVPVGANKEIVIWNTIINDLGRPMVAELLFGKGRYYLHATDVGYLIVGMRREKNLKRIRAACANVQEKLIDQTVRKKVLLKMLSDGAETTKPHLVKALIPLADAEVARVLFNILQQDTAFHPEIKEKLLLALCKMLRRFSIVEALPTLKKILQIYSANTSQVGRDIATAARLAIQQLEPALSVKAKAEVNPAEQISSIVKENLDFSNHSDGFAEDTSQEEQRIKDLLSRDQKRQAIALLMQLISKTAKGKFFQKAEQLRNWLMQIDSMALVESIRAAEIIEEEKNASINNEYLATWKDLLATLTHEEVASLYHAMTQRYYFDGEVVARQGEFHATLFFVNSGRIEINAVSKGREVNFLKVVESGEILGGETFFDASVWTVNAVSKGANLSLLTWHKLQSQKEDCPSLHLKLQHYCARFPSPSSIFIKTRQTRRHSERKMVSGKVTIDLLDQFGNEMGEEAKGILCDISKGGVALRIRFSRKRNAMVLLGKKIRVSMSPEASLAPLMRIGKVMAVRCHEFVNNDYSLHVQFEIELNNTEIQQFAGKTR
jgi:hypothetical protein